MNFQMSGEVSDDSMQALGQMLGAQSIVSGSLTSIGSEYRIVIRVLNVQTAAVAVQYRTDIANDERVRALLAGGRSGGTATAPTGSSQAQAAARLATPRNGTYSFWPRPRATMGGLGQKSWVDKIEVSGDFVNIYIVNTETGSAVYDSYVYFNLGATLLNLDNPRQSWQSVRNTHGNDSSTILTFQRITGTRFSLTGNTQFSWDTPWVFDEIILGEPD